MLLSTVDHYGEFVPTLQGVDDESWRKMTDQEKNNLVESICDELMASIEEWSPAMDGKSFRSNLLQVAF